MLLFFLLPFLSYSQECIANGTDYSSISRTENFHVYETQFFIFTFNICGPINDDDDVGTAYSKLNQQTISLGKYSTQTAVVDKFGVGFKYTGGTKQGTEEWSTTMYIKCDTTLEKDKVKVLSSDLDHLDVSLLFEGPGMCPVEKKGLSGWAILFILIAVVLVIVIAIFVAWLVFNLLKGKRGLEAIPIVGLCYNQAGYQEFN